MDSNDFEKTFGEAKPKPPKLGSSRLKYKIRERTVHHDDGEGNWLVSYADMMTLLFGFFVILSAFSTPDAGKMEKMKQETSKSMGVEYVNPYSNLSASLQNVLSDFKLDRDVVVNETDEGMELISRGTLFFGSGSAELQPQAKDLIEKIAAIVVTQAKGFRVIVEGHTDDSPIVSRLYPSNWELSAARAATVVRLIESKGFPHSSLRPMGLADTEPLVPNRDSMGRPVLDNQAQNRRIVIRIQPQLPRRMPAPSTEPKK